MNEVRAKAYAAGARTGAQLEAFAQYIATPSWARWSIHLGIAILSEDAERKRANRARRKRKLGL